LSGVDDLKATIEAFNAAALGAGCWREAVARLATSTGSMAGELIGIGSNAVVPFNIMTGVAPEAATQFLHVGGGDPAVNSRVRIGTRPGELEILDEHAFTTEADMRRNPAYGDWVREHDLRHICLTPLIKSAEMLVGLAVVRSERQGDIDAEHKRIFATVAPAVRTAVRTQMALQNQGFAMLTGVLDSMNATVFLCDQYGRARAMTASAETLVATGDCLRLVKGRLFPAWDGDRAGYEAALAKALAGRATRSDPIAVRRHDGGDSLLLEVVSVPQDHPLRFGVCALVIVHRPGADERRIAAAARTLYGFSEVEGVVAAQLAGGQSVTTIARERGISVGTVRTHVRRIFEKSGVNSQLSIAALLARFG
tara:strand:- start:37253 stop:38353 length:1101 start_codon:yes stop_codon:yes gene_type:complete